ncbi:MAG: bifunctional diaminohydroxyphosphoribosylaminopyrimidine deaminase/5-amino-6-(5-phosphoribosylamino)uracil reductase RibD [Bdellovibrionia bacterium]
MHFLKPGFSFGGPLEQILPNKLWTQSGLPSSYSPPLDLDSHFMLEALKESLSSVGISNPNPAVGCILVDAQGHEISRGATQAYLGPHAERHALGKISNPELLNNATAYVTLEPCSHHGNQPPCVDLFISSKIKRVVIARMDPNPLVSGDGIRKLLEAGKEVSVGINHAEITAWNFAFFAYQTLKRPIFILKWAQTLDGQLADDQGKSQWITSPIARSYTHWLRQKYDTLLVGAGTVLADYPKLTVRDCDLPHQAQPLPIIFDPRGKLLGISKKQMKDLRRNTLTEGRKFVHIITKHAARNHVDSWVNTFPDGLILTLSDSDSDPSGVGLIHQLASLMRGPELARALGRPLQSVMIEGGPQTLSLFLQAGYADLLHVFLAPMLSGGEFNRIKLMQLFANSKRFELISSSRLGPDTVMEMVNSNLIGLFK